MSSEDRKLGVHATWAMAVGGMVGGGIFSVLGVVIEVAGPYAWLSFVIGGLIALATADSYARLTASTRRGGGSFGFLRAAGWERTGAVMASVLILGYVLTMSVYAFTFGHYAGEVLGLGGWTRVIGVGIVAVLAGINLLGVGQAAGFEVGAVWAKLVVLAGLAAFGLAAWDPGQLDRGLEGDLGLAGAFIGAASVFMAYEGFQLLAYDYDELRDPPRTLAVGTLVAVLSVIGLYVAVTLGATMLVGAASIVEEKEVALAVAGREALGTVGMVVVSIGAAFSTGSAINATLFATARLARDVADEGDLPRQLAHRGAGGIPDLAVVGLAVAAAVLAAIGGLTALVEAASLIFLVTFGVVNVLAAQATSRPWISIAGAAGAIAAATILVIRLALTSPLALGALAVIAVAASAAQMWLRSDRSGAE